MATDAGHDFAFSFTVVDPGPYQVVGLTPFPAFTANAVAFGFDFTGGMWRILENGAIPTGTGAQTATFFPNTRFTIAWNSASQQIIYYVSAPAQYDYAFISNHAGAMPLVPHALMYTHGAEVLNAQIAATVATGQQWWKLRSDGLSIWGAILQLATDTDYHVRQGRDAAGGPNRSVEFGPFGTQSTCRFVDGMGGDVQQMTLVPNHRVIAAITQTGPDATTLVNLTTPMGGGGSNPVTLEHLWRILNDPRYENYGRYPGGYRSSAGIVFPEYNAAFPIYRRGMAVGGYEYYVVHRDSVAQYGEMQGGGADSQYSYTDPNPSTATKELTERALYVSAVGKLTSAGEPHLTLTFETDGRGKPVRAGDYAYVEYHSYGNVNGIPFQRLDVDDWFQVLRCTRAYATSGGVTDTWLVSNNGKYRSTDATFAADQARQLAAVQTTTQANTSMFIWPTTFRELDSLNDVVVDLRILPNVTRCQSAYLRVRFEQYRQTISLAQNSDATITIPIPHGFHRVNPVAGSSFIPTGILTSTETPGLPIHVHPISVINQTRNLSIPSVPYNAAPDRYLWMGGDGESVTVFSNGHSGTIYTLQPPGTGANAVDLTPAKHPHTAPIQQSLDNEYPTTLTGPLPQHTHALTSAILLKDRPAAIQVWIDNGSGQFANVTPELMNQVSNTQGGAGFTSDFEVEISRYFTQPGRVARIRFVSIGNGSNPQGLGAIAYSGTFAFEFNGLATTALLQL
jgi:hypothetical protein